MEGSAGLKPVLGIAFCSGPDFDPLGWEIAGNGGISAGSLMWPHDRIESFFSLQMALADASHTEGRNVPQQTLSHPGEQHFSFGFLGKLTRNEIVFDFFPAIYLMKHLTN